MKSKHTYARVYPKVTKETSEALKQPTDEMYASPKSATTPKSKAPQTSKMRTRIVWTVLSVWIWFAWSFACTSALPQENPTEFQNDGGQFVEATTCQQHGECHREPPRDGSKDSHEHTTDEFLVDEPPQSPEPAPSDLRDASQEIPEQTQERNNEPPEQAKEKQPTELHTDKTERALEQNGDNGVIELPRESNPEPAPARIPTIVTLAFDQKANQLTAQPYLFYPNGQLSAGLPQRMDLQKYTYEGKAVTTLNHDHLYIVHFDSKTGPYNIEQRKLFGFQKKSSYALRTRRPTALFARNHRLYVGGIEKKLTRIDTIDFRNVIPIYRPRFTAKDSYRQEIDDFAVTGDTLIAIDDVVIPKYAFVFAMQKDGSFKKHLFTSILPIVIGGTYPEGVADGDWLYMRGTFENGHGLGGGQNLLRLKINKADIREQVTLSEYRYDNGQADPKRDLFHGKTFTTWQGMEVLGDVLLVGAGERGIFSMPKQFKVGAKGTQLYKGMHCSDITRVGTHVYALFQVGKTTELHRLHWDAVSKSVKTLHKHTLKDRPTRFPR